eukprot:TRINITY_DN13918_c0_g1_i1.p1 TRINITY_DN13918_c0_g1~~TRINITY_DN13918_c0_g1_i1.p1  ORF type:complete len:713 (+),score=154.37 TRINITY_DN13918_c0_g1_i1:103-2139(+)
MTSLAASTNIEDRLSRHEDVLRSYKEKFEEHKRWLQGQREMPSFATKETGQAWEEDTLSDDEESIVHTRRRTVPLHDTLLEKGKLYEQKKEACREVAIKSEMAKLRAKPRITKMGRSKNYDKRIEERFIELENRRQNDLKDARAGREEDKPQFTFKPSITKKGKRATVRTNTAGAHDQWKQRRDQKLDDARQRVVIEELSQMQSAPVINEHSQRIIERKAKDDSGISRGPHYTHADSLLERDRLSKLNLWEKYQQEQVEQQPGNPKITPFAANLQREGEVCQRLYEQSFDKEERKNHLALKKAQEEGTECYHTPRITMNAAVLRRSIPVEDDLLERHEISKSRKEEGMRQALEREQHLHKPAINPVSDEIASRLCQTSKERLYGQKTDYSALQQQFLDAQESVQSSQRRSSSHRRRSSTVDFHLRGKRGKEISEKRIEDLRSQHESKIMADCTFKPRICRPPLDRTNRQMDFLDRAQQQMKKKDENLREARLERDRREQDDCPFKPNIGYNSDIVRDDGIYGGDGKAWGYGDFVERHRMARKLQSEKDKGGWVTGKNWKNEVTVPREFSLGRKEGPIKSLQKPLSPPRVHPGSGHDKENYPMYQSHTPKGGHQRDLPQQGLFSEVLQDYHSAPQSQMASVHKGGYSSYDDHSGVGSSAAVPPSAWGGQYPSGQVTLGY